MVELHGRAKYIPENMYAKVTFIETNKKQNTHMFKEGFDLRKLVIVNISM